MRERSIPEATVGRLPVYLRGLVEMAENGTATISSEQLAEYPGRYVDRLGHLDIEVTDGNLGAQRFQTRGFPEPDSPIKPTASPF